MKMLGLIASSMRYHWTYQLWGNKFR